MYYKGEGLNPPRHPEGMLGSGVFKFLLLERWYCMSETENSKFGVSLEELRDLAVNRLVEGVTSEHDLTTAVKAAVERHVKELYADLIEKKVGEALDVALHQMLDAQVTPVDIFGEPTGEPTTIRDTLVARTKGFWTDLVDSDGKLPKEVTAWNRGKFQTRAQWMIGKMAADDFAEHVKDHSIEILTVLKGKLLEDGKKSLEHHLNRLIKV